MTPLDLVDHDLHFDPVRHEYFHRGRRLRSVTELIEHYSQPFDAESHAAGVSRRRKISKDQVLKEWSRKGRQARALGTAVHNEAERIVWQIALDKEWFPRPDLFAQWEDGAHADVRLGYCAALWRYFRDHGDLFYARALAPEIRLADPDLGLAGTCDLLYNDAHGDVMLLDWKTSATITAVGWSRMRPPLADLEDANWIHYSLQLWLYRLMLERRYGLQVDGLAIVQLGRAGSYYEWDALDLREHAERIIHE